MGAVLTAALMTAAEISNLFSVVGVIICFFCMVIFILRLQGEDLFGTSTVHVAPPARVRVAYQKVHIPFSLELHKPGEATYCDVQVKMQSDVNYSMRSFWGVSAPHLHTVMAAPWSTFFTSLLIDENPKEAEQDQVEEEQLEEEKVQEVKETLTAQVKDEVERKDIGETVKRIGLASSTPLPSLGQSPRTTYPLVLCMLRQEKLENEEDPSEVGALINIIHIKDPDCQVPTCVLHQYIKQYSGQITRLQALYTQGSSSSEGRTERMSTVDRKEAEVNDKLEEQEKREAESTREDEEEEEMIPLEEACVICQTKRTTRALLPCRHVCTCNTCFCRLDTCPMCRTPIRAYFLVGPEDSEGDGEAGEGEDDSEQVQAPLSWRRIADAVTRVLLVAENVLRGVQW
ncbi:hypothetical protein Pcinc_041210 [Petrolisthes cinctipes]|uniref:RING-type domain-containing protein n=1 Tax=Petrolisthes cinctipes TaxID=88211 RepID=A0AAE1BKK2_PETCI|nr:hypothetical protein Pcinc_041210 [Petrolisthes cinctipes]